MEPLNQKGSLSQQQLLANLQALSTSQGRWVVILAQGGHFAASVFEKPSHRPAQQSKKDIPLFDAVEHKTFHRYVIRCPNKWHVLFVSQLFPAGALVTCTCFGFSHVLINI